MTAQQIGANEERARPMPIVCDHCRKRKPRCWRLESGKEWWFCPECYNERGIRGDES